MRANMILKLYIRNLWEFASLVWSGTSPRETCDQNLSLFLGQEVIAHRRNLQWGEQRPHQGCSERPLSWASFKYNERSPGSEGRGFWLAPFLFPLLLSLFHGGLAHKVRWDWCEPRFGRRKGEGSTQWPTKLNYSTSLAPCLKE